MVSDRGETWSLANVLRRLARQRPGHEALVSGERRLTFGELDERSSRVASGLISAGVGSGDRVAVLVKNGTEFYEIDFGVSKANGTLAALNWRLSAFELAAILADARPTVVIADPEFEHLVGPAAERSWDMQVITIGDQYEQWLADSSPEDPQVPSSPDDVMLVLYSSGTTGLPKGVMLTNANLSYIELMATELFRMTSDSVHLVVAPLFHIGGGGTGLTTTTLGGRTVILQDVRPDAMLEAIERERVTHAFMVPAVIQRLIESPDARRRDLSSLQYISYGGAPMTETLLRNALDALGCGFIGCYGMTETAGTVTSLPPEEHVFEGPDAHKLRSVGRELPWHSVRVTDLETGEEAAPGKVGEIWVKSGMNMKGYFEQPEATAGTLVAGGWLRTGDGAYRDADGYFFLADRIKDMIISGGENVYPAEVENVLAAHPDVGEVAVIGVPHEKWGETVKAVVVPRPGTGPNPAELIAFSRERLAHYKCPTSVEYIGELPRNPSGKVIKKTLRELYNQPSVGQGTR
jgi:acyl-CoA synthetase (AMP-forming)/AMP-acid ligase II